MAGSAFCALGIREDPLPLRLQLTQRLVGLLLVRWLTMPGIVAFHVTDALARHGVRDDDLRLALDFLCFLGRRNECFDIVAVALQHFPIESAILVSERFE